MTIRARSDARTRPRRRYHQWIDSTVKGVKHLSTDTWLWILLGIGCVGAFLCLMASLHRVDQTTTTAEGVTVSVVRWNERIHWFWTGPTLMIFIVVAVAAAVTLLVRAAFEKV